MNDLKKEKFILQIIRYAPALFIILISVFATIYLYLGHLNDLEKAKKTIENQYLKSNKDRIKATIEIVNRFIIKKASDSERALKEDLQNKINIANKIATNIYNKNKDTLSKDEIIRHIKNAIETLRYNQGRGYFSIHTLKGINILNPVFRELEGTFVFDRKGISGNYPVRDAINIAKTKGEGFFSWYYYKPNDKSKKYKKIGIVKKFEPYDLIITTAEFEDDFKKHVQKEILKHLNGLEYQNGGHVFVIDKKGEFLLTRSSVTNISEIKKENHFSIGFKDFINSDRDNTYLQYIYKFGKDRTSHSKIAYLKKVNIYDWVIGNGFDYDSLNVQIINKQKELEKKYKEYLTTFIFIAICITILLLVISLLMSNFLEKLLLSYKKRLLEKETLKFEAMMEELNIIFDNLPINVIYKDTKDNIIRGNKTLANALGLNVEELRNIPTKKLFPHFYKRYYEYDLKVIKSKKVEKGIIEKYYSKEGLRLINYSNIPILDKNGEVKNIIVFVTDITDQETLKEDNKRKEILLYQQSKMATMGEMIANIAHQWRQPLSAISTAATGSKLLKEIDSLSDEQLNIAFDTINDSAQFLSQTIDDFRNFFNPNKNKLTEFHISVPIEKTLKLLLPKFLVQDIEIIKDIEDIKIMSLENEIIQVLINVLNNARDELIKSKQRRLIFIKTYKKDNSLFIEIKDNAGGIKNDIIHKVFESYFTTKESTHGTGIGLYMSKDILTKLLNADIYVKNESYIFEDVEYTGANFIIKMDV